MFKITLITGILVLTGILDAAVYAQETDPVLTSSAKYSMPESALNAEIGGTVVMGISVDATGKPARALLISGPMWPCGADPAKALEDLSATLTETMMSLRFTPGTTDGKPDEKAIALTLQLKNPKLALVPGPVDPATGKPRPTRISGGVLNGKATELPKPAYPAEARTNRDSGAVSIEVLIDEDGKVVRAGAVSGAPTLQYAARDAACRAKFSATTLSGNPVKVSGVMTYNFVP